MSYELIWVQGHNGKFYCQPEFYSTGKYLIVFDDVEDPILILSENIANKSNCQKMAVDLLKSLGIKYENLKPPRLVRKRADAGVDIVGWCFKFELAGDNNFIPTPDRYYWEETKPPKGSIYYGSVG